MHGLGYDDNLPVGNKGLEKVNLLTKMNQGKQVADFDPTTVYQPDLSKVYVDAEGDDFTPVGSVWGIQGHDLRADLLNDLALLFPAFDFNKDFGRNPIDWSAPFLGPIHQTVTANIPPILTNVSTTIDSDYVSFVMDTNLATGTIFWRVDTTATRSGAEIAAGGGVSSGSQAVSAAGPQPRASAEDLVPETAYFLHIAYEHGAGNFDVISTAFTTTAAATGLVVDNFSKSDRTYPDWSEMQGTKSYDAGSKSLDFVVTDGSTYDGTALAVLNVVDGVLYQVTINVTSLTAARQIDMVVGTTLHGHDLGSLPSAERVSDGETKDMVMTFTASGAVAYPYVRIRGAADATNNHFKINSIVIEAV